MSATLVRVDSVVGLGWTYDFSLEDKGGHGVMLLFLLPSEFKHMRPEVQRFRSDILCASYTGSTYIRQPTDMRLRPDPSSDGFTV